jgi:hypothetical protein
VLLVAMPPVLLVAGMPPVLLVAGMPPVLLVVVMPPVPVAEPPVPPAPILLRSIEAMSSQPVALIVRAPTVRRIAVKVWTCLVMSAS